MRRLDCVLQPSLEAVHTKTKLSAKALELVRKGVGTRDKTTELCTNEKGEVLSDLELRDAEYVPLHEDINRYFARLYAAAQPCGDSGGKKLLAELFGVDVRTISEHFGKLSGSGELAEA